MYFISHLFLDELNTYWPKWSLEKCASSGYPLENILNISANDQINYSKLKETCCVYTNKTPVMTLRRGFSSAQNQDNWFKVENRRPSFVSKWLLYNNVDDRPLNQTSSN